MSDTTKIEWCDHSWSPWEGCTKVSPGCLNCYAEARDKRHLFGPESHWGKGAPRRITKDWKRPVKFSREPICVKCGKDWPARGAHQDFRNPRVFPSVCDWLDEEVLIDLFVRFLKLIYETQNIDWLLLTKRPEKFFQRLESAWKYGVGTDDQRFQDWLRFWGMNGVPPSNVWIGTSVEDQTRANQRVPELLKIPARVRFLSVEPLLGEIDLSGFLWGKDPVCVKCPRDADCVHGWHTRKANDQPSIDWVIVGGESGIGARPCNVDWVRSIVIQCADAGVPCFVKQLGARVIDRNDRGFEGDNGPSGWPMDTDTADTIEPGVYQGKPILVRLRHPKGGDPSEWPENLRVRQFPEVKP